MVARFPGQDQVSDGENPVIEVDPELCHKVLQVMGIVKHSCVLPVVHLSGQRMAEREIRIEGVAADLEGTFVAEGDVVL